MKSEVIDAIRMLAKEKEIPEETLTAFRQTVLENGL